MVAGRAPDRLYKDPGTGNDLYVVDANGGTCSD